MRKKEAPTPARVGTSAGQSKNANSLDNSTKENFNVVETKTDPAPERSESLDQGVYSEVKLREVGDTNVQDDNADFPSINSGISPPRIRIIPFNRSKSRYKVIVDGRCVGGESTFKWSDILVGVEKLEERSRSGKPLPHNAPVFAKCWDRETDAPVDELKKVMEDTSRKNIPEEDLAESKEVAKPLPKPDLVQLWNMLRSVGLDYLWDRFEIIACVNINAAFEWITAALWLLIQGPAACGKDFLCEFFDDKRIMGEPGHLTKNALSPGKASTESDDPIGVLMWIRGLMWLIKELGSLFRDEDEAVNFLFDQLQHYGKTKAHNSDPTGPHEVEIYFTTCYCGTESMVQKLMTKIAPFGPRYLILELFSRRKKVVPIPKEKLKKIKEMVTSIILDRKQKTPPEVPENVREEAYQFALKFSLIRSASYAEEAGRSEDTNRIQLTLETGAMMLALLEERKPEIDDVYFWAKLFYPTIGHRWVWKRILNGKQLARDPKIGPNWHKIIRNNLESMGLGENVTTQNSAGVDTTTWTLNDEYRDFVTKIVNNLDYSPSEIKAAEEEGDSEADS